MAGGRAPKGGAVEIGVEVTAAGDFEAGDACGLNKGVGDFLSDKARSFFEALGQLKADRGGRLAHLDLRRTVDNNVQRDGIVLLDVARHGVAEAISEGQVHGSS